MALLRRNIVTHSLGLIPTFLTRFIPALFLSIDNRTYSLSNCCADLLSNSIAHLLISSATLTLCNSLALFLNYRLALLFSNSLTFLLISMLGNRFLDNFAIFHMWNIKALFFMHKLTLVSGYIISFCLSLCFTYLLMLSLAFFLINSVTLFGVLCVTLLLVLSVTFLFMLSFTLLFRYILTLLLWYRLSPGNLHSMTLFSRFVIYLSIIDSVALVVILSVALLFSAGDSVRHLDSVALLPGLIPALFLPDCSAGRNTTVGTSKQKQEAQHLHSLVMIMMSTKEILPM